MTTRTMPVEPTDLRMMHWDDLIKYVAELVVYAQATDAALAMEKERGDMMRVLCLSAQKRAEKAETDALRYRWLRKSCCGKNPNTTAIIEANEILLDADEMTFKQLDAAIDAAMKECGK